MLLQMVFHSFLWLSNIPYCVCVCVCVCVCAHAHHTFFNCSALDGHVVPLGLSECVCWFITWCSRLYSLLFNPFFCSSSLTLCLDCSDLPLSPSSHFHVSHCTLQLQNFSLFLSVSLLIFPFCLCIVFLTFSTSFNSWSIFNVLFIFETVVLKPLSSRLSIGFFSETVNLFMYLHGLYLTVSLFTL